MENTLENKAKFFAQYWGQLVCKENGDHFPMLLQAKLKEATEIPSN